MCSRGWLGALLLTAAFLQGCAQTEIQRGSLRYELAPGQEGKTVHFPPPPDVPRYAYAGELIGERNFIYDRPDKTFGQKLFEFLTGVGEGSYRELELLRPQAVAVDPLGRIIVSDMGHTGVIVFDAVEGEARLLRRSTSQSVFVAPSGIAIGPLGTFFVADAGAGLVARIDVSGETYAPIGKGVLKRPTGVVFDKIQQRLFVADTDESMIKVFDLEGRLIMTIGQPGVELGEFNRPTYMAASKTELYVTDTFNSRIQVFDLDSGQPKRIIGQRGTFVGQLGIPKGVAVDSEGNVYVVESLFDHLLVFDKDGRLLLPIGGTGYNTGNFYLPAGLWVDEGDKVYVADMYNGRVVTYHYLGSFSESEE